MTRNGKGALFVLASALTFTLSVSLIKYLGKDVPPSVQAFFRQLFSLLILAPLILKNPVQILRTSRPWYMLSRTAATSAGIILAYTSYQHLALAEANALSFTRQLFMVPLAIMIIREQVEWQRMIATIMGFAGVVVILQPGRGGDLISVNAFYGLLAAFLTAWSVIGVKAMARDHSQMTLLAWSVVLGALFSLPSALMVWRTPGWTELALLVVLGVFSTITQALYIRGMTLGDATVLAPIDYTRIIFTTGFGFFLFNEVPGWPTVVGSAIIILAAIYITIRAHRRARAAASGTDSTESATTLDY
ncbi:drug/metabolite transporter (DMT)-like permease [Sphingobium sp. AEW010]|nr:drug/metabolite transporter (DMT)-like permease [Sphingobium sp. JAI105]TWD05687.1 drug/metabolite transporter (DMT)-like permease [Sphingobium sp. AEW010]TWD23240.1 drug/metabolite transporter (DMT)-like permease [Sphingobium sp. AEW013]TWD25100.1 drug/metabolite transporter (DMT)-like permease [Sphingobium sp. AEW001]